MQNQNNNPEPGAWGTAAPLEALKQAADLVARTLGLTPNHAFDGRSCKLSAPTPESHSGIRSASLELVDESLIVARLELMTSPATVRIAAATIFRHLAGLGERCHLVAPASDEPSLGVEMKIQATPMSLARASAFVSEVRNLNDLAVMLQAEVPTVDSDEAILTAYKGADHLEPILPWNDPQDLPLDWARDTVDFLMGAVSVAVASPNAILEDFALAALAHAGKEHGRTFARIVAPAINGRSLIEAVNGAPGIVIVPAVRMSLGTSPYELGNEMQALLAALVSAGTPALFTGTIEQLQSVFHGGQGGSADPLTPVLRHAPQVNIGALARFAVRTAARRIGGIAQHNEQELTRETISAIETHSQAERMRILPSVATRAVSKWARGNAGAGSLAEYAAKVGSQSETLAGLSARPRSSRSAKVEERFTRVLTDADLGMYFKRQLLGQDAALGDLVARLRTESLTRPSHQPIRYCAQGTPATGKSESAVLLARRLDVPYVNIDAASIPDYYTAAAQLLGSGRGIVGSYQSGRLEQAAKHHRGAVVEVSDLDHASSAVRSALADLFLQVLETGEAQAANGAMFSCANLIFAFTMNLPDGMDETVRKGIGFNNEVSRDAVAARVSSEIKRMLSGAFLSRVGAPILFEPIAPDALASIIERATRSAVQSAAERLGINVKDVIIEEGTGEALLSSQAANAVSYGARAILERGRALAAEAAADMSLNCPAERVTLKVAVDGCGKLVIQTCEEDE